jgi:streptomycin 6-kinase
VTTTVPEGLAWWRSRPGGAAWLERLPRLVDECAAAWGLHVRAPFPRATVSFVAPAVLPGGAQAVLKLSFPEPESEHEAAALACWGGRGAARLLAEDAGRRALLVERCMPGTQLWQIADEAVANRFAAEVLRQLWRAPPEGHAFRSLAGEASRWASQLPRRFEPDGSAAERGVVDRAVAWIGELLESEPDDVALLHQDLHGGNILRAERDPWLAIDPKPLVGERAFDVASLLRDRRDELAKEAHPVDRIRRRLDQLSEALELDRERMRRWAVIHALAWGMEEGERFDDILACAVWLDRA